MTNLQNPSVSVAYVMLVVVMLLWASGIVVARSVFEVVPPVGFSFWRWVCAVIIMTPIAAAQTWQRRSYLAERVPLILMLGFFMAWGSTAIVVAVQYTSATNVALVSASQPIVTALIAWVLVRHRLTRWQISGVVAATLGVVGMIARFDVEVLRSLSFNLGDVVILLSLTGYALYAVNLHRWVPRVGPLVMMYVTCLGVALVLFPVYVAESIWIEKMVFDRSVLMAMLYLAMIPTLLATIMWNISVGVVGPNRATIFTNLLPLFGITLAVSFLNEALRSYHIIGGMLVCAGITLVVKPERGA
jgi:drug/metabolite transporter (DMT)-like permease